jgi:hypothetical protein
MADKETKIIGVFHETQHLGKPLTTIKKLIETELLDSSRPVGIELPEERIRFMEKLYLRGKTLKTQASQLRRHCEEELARAARVNRNAAKNLKGASRKKIVDKMTAIALSQYGFWYPIYQELRRANIPVVPLTNSSLLARLGAEMLKKEHPTELRSSLIRGPIQEEVMERKIIAENVQLALVGGGHADSVKERLQIKGIQARVILREQSQGFDRLTAPTAKARRHYAEAKRKRREKQMKRGISRSRKAE